MQKQVSWSEALAVWAKIGVMSFGGPAGQIALMYRLLVEEKKWISEARFLHALNYCMLLPGPEAQQLATYIGWSLHRTWGGVVAGTLFVLPGALVILALSVLYAGFHDVTLVTAAFYGIKAAVLVIVIDALRHIASRALKTGALYAVAGAAFVAIFFLDLPFPLIILAAAVCGLVFARKASPPAMAPGSTGNAARPSARHGLMIAGVFGLLWLLPLALLYLALGPDDVFTQLGVFFSRMAMVTFGGAYAVLSYVGQEAVGHYGWLHPGEMLDGLGLAETTPGPLILVLEFVGFLAAFRDAGGLDPYLAGTLGALITLWFTFMPCFMWIFLGAPYIDRLQGNRHLNGALTGVTAAVVGVILNLALWFAIHVLFGRVAEERWFGLRLLVPDLQSLDLGVGFLGIAAAFMMLRWRLGMGWTLTISGGLGMIVYHVPEFMRAVL